jgi:pantothenate kinase
MSIELLVEQIQSLLNGQNPRTLIGIVGKPGAGKSTVVEEISKKFDSKTVSIIPMDGFHLSNEELISLGRRDRKGAPDTFNVEGFTSLIKRVKSDSNVDHMFPIFHREIEASIADEGMVPKESKVVVIEGNYLFSEDHNWDGIYPLLDHTWFIEIKDEVRLERLIARHIRFGKTPEEAEAWSRGSDETNARFIGLTAYRAENLIKLR